MVPQKLSNAKTHDMTYWSFLPKLFLFREEQNPASFGPEIYRNNPILPIFPHFVGVNYLAQHA